MSFQEESQSFREMSPEETKQHMKMYQVTFEERDQILRPLGETGMEAVGSMGDDKPWPCCPAVFVRLMTTSVSNLLR